MRKKLLSILALLCLTVSSAWADGSWTSGNCTVTLSGGVLTVSGSGAMDNYISDSPWSNSSITSIVIEAGVTHIGDFAFSGCNNASLTTVTIPNSVKSIGSYAFQKCTSLTTVDIAVGSSLTTIGAAAFRYCSGLTSFTIPVRVTTINGWGTFADCTSLKDVYCYAAPFTTWGVDDTSFSAPTKFHVHDASAWSAYYNLDNLEFVGDLSPVTIASGYCGDPSVNSGKDVTWTLTSAGVLTVSGSGDMADYNWRESPWYNYIEIITSIVIEDGVTSIGDDAFFGCTGLTSIEIPDDVTSIDDQAFYGCSNLTTVIIGSGVTSIGDFAFGGCCSLTTITVSGGTNLKVVDGVLFTYDGTRLIQYPLGSTATSYEIPDGVKTIGASAFALSKNLTEVTFPASVTTIGAAAFLDCTSLTSITIPASVTSIGAAAFYYCENLTTVTLNSNPYIDMNAFDIDGYGTTPAVTMNLTAKAAGGAKWMTFYNKIYNFEADENTQVFKAALSDKDLTLTKLETDQIVNSGNPVILKSTASPIVMTLTSTASSNDFSDNSLQGVSDAAGKTSDGTMFVLNYKDATGVGFYKLTSGKTLGVGKAYLTYSGSLAPDFFGFDGDATGIKTTDYTNYTDSDEWYNLNGQRVAQPTKGLYIVNGKKVVVK